jgi:hypothetical protein
MSRNDLATPRNVFICSAGHSGSTLLDMMLGSHSAATSLGELNNLPMDMAMNRRCACGDAMQDCSLWSQVIQRMGADCKLDPYKLNLGYTLAKMGDSRSTSLVHRILTRPKLALRYIQLRHRVHFFNSLTPGFTNGITNTLEVYRHVRVLTNKPIIIDSTKHYLRAVSLYLEQPETTRIVLLVRDGRGVFYSNLKRGFGRDYSLRAWHSHYKRGLTLIEKYVAPSHRIWIHYEDMVTQTQATLSRICEFLGISYEPAMLEFRTVKHHNVNGNDMKFSSSGDLRLDEAWKAQIEKDDLLYFERKAGKLNQRLGYI